MSTPQFHFQKPADASTGWAVRLIPGYASSTNPRTKKAPGSLRTDIAAMMSEMYGTPADATNFVESKPTPPSSDFAKQTFTKNIIANSPRNILIVGAGDFGRRVGTSIKNHPQQGRAVRGFIDDSQPLGGGVLGRTRDLARVVRTNFIDEIILPSPAESEITHRVLDEARRLHIDVEMALDLAEYGSAIPVIHRFADIITISLHREASPVARLLMKRTLDVFAAGFGLLFLAPVFVLIACLIRWDSRGPVIYSAARIGKKGRPFRCYKFRTMVTNADELKSSLRQHNERSGPFFKIADDPRITRIGRWLRRYSLDELSQLWNVLRGEMSLVGPRPHPLDDFSGYTVEHLARLDVTPGITGLWQITARSDPSFEKGIELDRDYIGQWSLTMDLIILFKTVRAVLQGSGV